MDKQAEIKYGTLFLYMLTAFICTDMEGYTNSNTGRMDCNVNEMAEITKVSVLIKDNNLTTFLST